MGRVKKGHMQISTSDIHGAGVYEGGDVLVFKKIAILLSGNTFFTDILNETTHNCYDYIQNPIIRSNRNTKSTA